MGSRLFWFLIGCAIGIAIGYMVRHLRETRDGVDRVRPRVARDDRGLIRYPLVLDTVLLLVVIMTVYAAIASQLSSNKVSRQQGNQNKIIACNNTFLQGTIAALNARTVYTVAQADANVALQVAFQKVVDASLSDPPLSEAEAREVVKHYADALYKFIKLSGQTSSQIKDNPYPTPEAFLDCLTDNS